MQSMVWKEKIDLKTEPLGGRIDRYEGIEYGAAAMRYQPVNRTVRTALAALFGAALVFPAAAGAAGGRFIIERSPQNGRVVSFSFPDGQQVYYRYDSPGGPPQRKRFVAFRGLARGNYDAPSSPCWGAGKLDENHPYCTAVIDEMMVDLVRLPTLESMLTDEFQPPTSAAISPSERQTLADKELTLLAGVWYGIYVVNHGSEGAPAAYRSLSGGALDEYRGRGDHELAKRILKTVREEYQVFVQRRDREVASQVTPISLNGRLLEKIPAGSCSPEVAHILRWLQDERRFYRSTDERVMQKLGIGSTSLFGVDLLLPSLRGKIFVAPQVDSLWEQGGGVFLEGYRRHWYYSRQQQLAVAAILRAYFGDPQFDVQVLGDGRFPWLAFSLAHEFGHLLQSLRYPWLLALTADRNLAGFIGALPWEDPSLREFGQKIQQQLAGPFLDLIERNASYFALDLLAGCI